MRSQSPILNDQNGSALIIAIMFLLMVTIIGIAAMNTSTTEVQIATNDNLHKLTFYEADGGTEIGQEMIEINFPCWVGFPSSVTTIGDVVIDEPAIWTNNDEPSADYPSDSERDFHYPAYSAGDSVPHTNVRIFGGLEGLKGGAFQMAAAYEMRGKALGAGGAAWVYEIHSQNVRPARNAEAVVRIKYRHVIGAEGVCEYY